MKKALLVAAVFLLTSAAGLWTWKHRYTLFARFMAQKGELKLLSYGPTQEEVPIAIDGISVMFDRAMVPLTTLDQGREDAIPLEISPRVDGSFHWLGTHGFIFRPKNPLRPATRYTVSLPAGIPSLDGYRLKEKKQWAFTTVLPRVETKDNGVAPTLLPKQGKIVLRFNLAMKRSDVEGKLTLEKDGQPLETKRKYEWSDGDHILQVTFAEELPWKSTLKVKLPAGLLSERGTLGSQKEFSQTFATPEKNLKINRVWAAPNASQGGGQDEIGLKPSQTATLQAGDSVCYEFSQPIRKKSFQKAFHAENSAPYFYFSYYDSFPVLGPDGEEALLEGYKQACAVFLEKHNQTYSFSVKSDAIESLSGADLTAPTETYRVKTGHAGPRIFSNLTKNIISSKGPMQLHYRGQNLKSVQAKLYRLDKKHYTENVRNWDLNSEITIDSKTKLTLPLTEAETEIDEAQMKADYHQDLAIGGEIDQAVPFILDLNQFREGKPSLGLYLLELAATPQNADQEHPVSVLSMIQLTSVGIATKRDADRLLVWTTDLESGQPVSVPVRVEGKPWPQNGTKEESPFLLDGTTDAQGLALLNLPSSSTNLDTLCVEVASPDMASLSCDPIHNFPDYRYPMTQGMNFFAYIYTDRPIYRPGQKVYFSSFVREVRESRYLRADPKTPCEVHVSDAAGVEIYQKTDCVLGTSGLVSGAFDLENREDLPRGTYEIAMKVSKQTFTRAFQVTSYRKPSFKVEIKTDPEIVSGEALKADVTGAYYFGSPLRKARARWTLMTSTYVFSPEGFSDYQFIDSDLLIRKDAEGEADYVSDYEYDVVASSKYSEDNSFYDDVRPHGSDRAIDLYKDTQGNPVQNASRLSDKGILNIEYKTDLAKYPTSQILSLEASVTDPGHQEVSSSEEVIVHKGSFYLGIKPNQWVYGEKEKASISIVSLDTHSQKSPQKSFSASLVRRDYKYIEKRNARGYWELTYEPQDVLVKTLSAKTDAEGKATLTFDVPSGGFYRVVLKANDRGNDIQSAAEFYAWGSSYVPWRLDQAETIELVPDKDAYKIGDTAKILIKSLVPMTKALLTYERGHVLESKIIDLGGKNAPTIDVPIVEGMVPNFYLSVVAHTGRDAARPPLLFHGETELHVDPESKRLVVALTPDKPAEGDRPPIYRPGETVRLHIETKDPQGRPQKAQVVVSVADESVLKLLDYRLPDLVKKFYYDRNNNVRSTSSLFSLKAGDGGLGAGKKRRIFKDTAHFQTVSTDEQGKADIQFKLPDDLTTWVIEALGVSESKSTADFNAERQFLRSDLKLGDGTFVGGQRAQILSTQPAVLRTAFPRFLVWGDAVQGSIVATNRSAKELSGKIRLEIKGPGTFENKQKVQESLLTIAAHEEKTLPASLIVSESGERLTLSATFQNASETFDALENSWPVLDRFEPEVTSTSGITQGAEKEILEIPTNVLKDRGNLDLSLKATLRSATKASRDFLIDYPWECSEQKSAKMLALLMSIDEMDEKVIVERKLKIQNLIDTLQEDFANSDGGMKYWPESFRSDVFASAQVFWAFLTARGQGFDVDESAFQNLETFLSKTIQGENRLKHPDTTAFLLWTLSLEKNAVHWPRWVADEILPRKSTLSVSGVAYLMMAYQNLSFNNEVKILGERLATLAVQQPRHVNWPASNFFWSSAAKNTALAVTALMETDPQNPLVPRGLAYLFFRKKKQAQTTQDDLVLSWMAYRSSQIFKESETDFTANISLIENQKRQVLIEGTFDARNLFDQKTSRFPMKNLSSGELLIQKSGAGTLYYDMLLKTYAPIQDLPTREEGLIVSRHYYALDDLSEMTPLNEFRVGENYKGHIILVAPQDLNYVFIQEKLPAGFEPVDMNLATTSKALLLASQAGAPQADHDAYLESFLFPTYDDAPAAIDYGMDYFFSHQEVRDDALLWSHEFLPAGTYHIRYPVRATTAGTYLMPGTTASEFYEPEIFGRSRAKVVTIKR